MKWAALVLALAACNQIYSLDETRGPPDALAPLDRDHDGTPDLVDNCEQANDQADADEDGRGDICDNCPLVRNPYQENSGDADTVGDACDAHPAVDGDCLIVFDGIASQASFAAHWRVTSSMGQPAINDAAGGVELAPIDTGIILAVVLDEQDNPLSGATDINLLGRVAFGTTEGAVAAVSNASTPGSGYACGMLGSAPGLPLVFATSAQSGASNIPSNGSRLSADPIDTSLLLRLSTRTEAGGVGCRTDYGLALGTIRIDPASMVDPGPGAPGIELQQVPLTIDAIAAYRVEPGACPTPIFR